MARMSLEQAVSGEEQGAPAGMPNYDTEPKQEPTQQPRQEPKQRKRMSVDEAFSGQTPRQDRAPAKPERMPLEQAMQQPQGRLSSAAGSVAKGAGHTSASALKGAYALQQSGVSNQLQEFDKLDELIAAGKKPESFFSGEGYEYFHDPEKREELRERWSGIKEDKSLMDAGKAVEDWVNQNIETNPEFKDEWLASKIPEGIGSFGAFALSSALSGGGATPAAVFGALSNAGSTFQDALDAGADMGDAYKTAVINAGVGTSEALPIASLFNRFDKASGGSIKRAASNMFKQGTEEAVQEFFQTFMDNFTASDLVGYDPERGMLEGTGEAAGVGGSVGSLMSAVMSIAEMALPGKRRGGGRSSGEPSPDGQPDKPAPEPDISGTVDDSIEDYDATGGDASQIQTADDLAETETGAVEDVALTGEDALAQQVEQEFGDQPVPGSTQDEAIDLSAEPLPTADVVAMAPDEEIVMEGPADPDLADYAERQGLTPAERQRTIQALEQELEPSPAETPIEPPQAPQEAGRAVQPESPQDLGQSPATDVTADLSGVPDSVFSAFPDLPESDGGLISLNKFTDEEKTALREAGITKTATTGTGQQYEGVDPENLWPERQARANKASQKKRSKTSAEPRGLRTIRGDFESSRDDPAKLEGLLNELWPKIEGKNGPGARVAENLYNQIQEGLETARKSEATPVRTPTADRTTPAQKPATDRTSQSLVGKYVRSGSTIGKVTAVSEDGKKATLDSGRSVPVGKAPNWTVQDGPFEGETEKNADTQALTDGQRNRGIRESVQNDRAGSDVSEPGTTTQRSEGSTGERAARSKDRSDASIGRDSAQLTETSEKKPAKPTRQQINTALRALADEKGYDSALISELHDRVGGDLEALKNTLRQGAKDGRYVLDVGDESLSSDQERAAAIDLDGTAHHRVRLAPKKKAEKKAAKEPEKLTDKARALGEENPNADVADLRRQVLKDAKDYDSQDIDDVIVAIHDGQYESVRKKGESLPVPVRESDIPSSLATEAFNHTSHSPERRGQSVIRDYVRTMVADWGRVESQITDENRDRMVTEFQKFKDGYASRVRAYLSAHSKVASAMIVGPAKFPTRSNQKKGDTADRRANEAEEWRKKGLRRLNKVARGTDKKGPEGELKEARQNLEARERAHEQMKAANRIVRKKNLSDDDKVSQLKELGFKEAQARELLKPDFGGRTGFPGYALTNNKSQIKRLQDRVTELEGKVARAEETGGAEEVPFDGGVVELDHANGYLRIRHESKPEKEVRDNLKSNGFRWSPKNTAWQRKLTNAARAAAEKVTGTSLAETRETDQGVGMFSKGATPGGMSVTEARQQLESRFGEKAIRKLEKSGRFTILNNPTELDTRVRRRLFGENTTARPAGLHDPQTGKSWLFTDHIGSGDAVGVFLHEVGAHYGLKRMIGAKEYRNVKKRLRDLANEGDQRVREAIFRVPDETADQFFWDEVLAYLVQHNYKFSDIPSANRAALKDKLARVLRKVVAQIRAFLNELGFLNTRDLTADDIVMLVRGAAKHAGKTAPKAPAQASQTVSGMASAPADTFYYQMERTLQDKLPNKGTAQSYAKQIRNLAKKGQFKQEELEWSGVLEWLDNFKQTPSRSERLDEEVLGIEAKRSKVVTKAEVLDFLRANRILVEEVTKGGGASFAELQEKLRRQGYDAEYDPLSGDINYVDPEGDYIDFDELPVELQSEFETENSAMDASNETKFANYQLPGGENYRELLLTLPNRQEQRFQELGSRALNLTDEEHAEYRELGMRESDVFRGGHFDEPNVLAHVRFNERTDADGSRVLFVEEVQSDWHQLGRRKGYRGKPDTSGWTASQDDNGIATFWNVYDESGDLLGSYSANSEAGAIEVAASVPNNQGAPDAPFKQTWPLLAMKRMIRYAAENGFDKIAWMTGEQQAARYDLSKQVESILVRPARGAGMGRMKTVRINTIKEARLEDPIDLTVNPDGKVVNSNKGDLMNKDLSDVIGKEMADKIMAVEEGVGRATFKGNDLKIGGEGMKAFYDKMLPSALNKYTKKWGARVGTTEIQTQPERYSFDKAYINAAKDFKVNGYSRGEAARGLEKTYSDASPREIAAALDNVYGVDQSVHALPITRQMREAVMEEGQPLFSKRRVNRDKLRRMGMDFENLPGDEVGSATRATEPVDQEPEALDPEKALEQLKKKYGEPMLSVDDEGGEGTLPNPPQQERAQRSLTGNRATEPETDADGLIDEDPRMDPLSKDLVRLVGFFESATDKMRRSGHPVLERLASRVDAYYDRNEARMGWINGRVRPILKRIPVGKKKAVMRDFEEYWRHHDNGREQAAGEVLNRNPVVRELVSEVKNLYSEMGDLNQKVGVQVYDASLNEGKGGWRDIGKVPRGKFWPRAFKPEVQRVLSNPKNDPKLWESLVDALIDEGHIETPAEADKYLRRYMGREVANDYFSGIEKARQRKLPEIFYDYSWDGFNRYSRKWSSRVTQIEQFGQKTGQNSEDLFEAVINSTKDQHTQNYVAALSDHVYSRRSTDIYTTLLQHLNLIATGTQLGNPATATLNFLGGTTLNVQMFGWRRVAKSYATMMRDWKKIQQTGVDLGILGKDVLNILRDTEQSAATYMDASGRVQDSLAKFAAFTMKWGGYKGTENIIRMNAMMSSWIQLQDALQQWNRNPKSSTSMKYRVFMQRNRIDADKLLAENGKGPETARYLRKMVNIPQGSYRPDMVPLYVDSPVGRFLFKYQKFGTQVSRMFWQNHLQPFVKTVVGGEKVLLPGQKLQAKTGNIIDEKTGKVVKSNRVRTFLPLLRYFAAALLGGSAILAARSFLFNYNDPGPEWDDLAEALDDDDDGEDRSLMWAMIFDRAYYSLFAASAAGFFGNYIQFGMDFADQQRVKNPLDPPGLASIDAVIELVMRSQEQGKLTARDLDNIGERTLALYRGYKRAGTKAMAMSGSGWKEARLRDAYTDLVYTKKMSRRFADEMDMKGRRTFSGRWGKTPMSPYNQQAYEALLLGDAESARAAYKQARQEMEDPGKVAQSMKSSVRARHPWNVGASQARANHGKFLKWAEKHASKANYQRIREIGRRYDRARQAAGL